MKALKRLLSLLLFLGLLWAFWFLATHDFTRPASKPPPVPAPDPWADMLTVALHVFVIGVMALLLAAGMAALYALLLHTRHRAQMATPDGRAPLSHPLAARWYDVREAEARRLTLPTTLTWSPSTTISRTGAEREMVAPEAIVHQPALSAEEALALPGIVYGRRLSDGELLTDTGVRSLAIGGRPGTGKTTTAVILAAQCVRLGASLEIVDPHAGHPESLTARMEPLLGRLPAAETPREALALVQKVHDILQQRKDSWRRSRNGIHGPDSPVALFLDEFPELVRLLSPSERQRMLDLIATIGYSSRKYGVATVLLAQSWLVAAVGSSQIRNPVPAAIVHGMRADEARSLTGIPAGGWPLDPQMLGDQEAVVVGVASGPVHVRVPTLSIGSPVSSNGWRSGPEPLPALGSGERLRTVDEPTANGRFEPLTLPSELPEERVLDLLAQGHDIGQVIRTLTHHRRGDQYQRLHLAIQRWLVRRALKEEVRENDPQTEEE